LDGFINQRRATNSSDCTDITDRDDQASSHGIDGTDRERERERERGHGRTFRVWFLVEEAHFYYY